MYYIGDDEQAVGGKDPPHVQKAEEEHKADGGVVHGPLVLQLGQLFVVPLEVHLFVAGPGLDRRLQAVKLRLLLRGDGHAAVDLRQEEHGHRQEDEGEPLEDEVLEGHDKEDGAVEGDLDEGEVLGVSL